MGLTFEWIVDELARTLLPLAAPMRQASGLGQILERFGYQRSDGQLAASATALADLADDIEGLWGQSQALRRGLEDGSAGLTDYLALADTVSGIYQSLRDLPSDLTNLGLPQGFAAELMDSILVNQLYLAWPGAYRLLRLLGAVDHQEIAAGGSRDADYLKLETSWDRIPALVQDPGAWARDVYGWGTADFDPWTATVRLGQVARDVGLYVMVDQLDDAVVQRFFPTLAANAPRPEGIWIPILGGGPAEPTEVEAGLVVLPVDGSTPTDGGVAVMPYLQGAVSGAVELTSTMDVTVTGDAAVSGGMVLALRPSGLEVASELLAPASAVDFGIELALRPDSEAGEEALSLLRYGDAIQWTAERLVAAVGGGVDDVFFAAGVEGSKLTLDVAEDGLLGNLVRAPIEVEIGDLVLGWRPGRGFYFDSGGGLSVKVPLSVELGGLRLHEVALEVDFEPSTLAITVDADLTVGPLLLGVEGLGMALSLAQDEQGNFGNAELTLGLQLPHGYAVGMEGGPVSASGALVIDDTGYKGALSVRIEPLEAAAFAVLTTSVGQGVSFLASIYGNPRLPLGFGFFLTGVGGILGIHRTVDLEELRDTLSEGRLDSVLFPDDPTQDLLTILDDLESVFPAEDGQYLFGPMARVGWGVPTLIEGKIGVILEVGASERLVILGSLGTALPTREAAIVVLNVSFVGSIDFDTGAVAFDASIEGSRVLSWPLSGEMALRTGWGQSAGLIASAGGLHPQYPQPPDFPSLQRLTINFGTNNPSLTLTAYMALTLDSVQAGASASLYVRGPKIPLLGQTAVEGWCGFDALIYFNPFAFDVGLDLGLLLLVDGSSVCGIGGAVRLRGPNTYVISGKVWVTVFGFDVKVPVEHSWGHRVSDATQTADPLALLREALSDHAGWEPIPASSRVAGVSLADTESSATVVDPSGGARLDQRTLPLGVRLQRIGNAVVVGDDDTFDLVVKDTAGGELSLEPSYGDFVRGHFFDTTEQEKLRGPAFERHRSGVVLDNAEDLETPSLASEVIDHEYETIQLLDDDQEPRYLGRHTIDEAQLVRWMRISVDAIAMPLNRGFVPSDWRYEPVSVTAIEFTHREEAVDVSDGDAGRPIVESTNFSAVREVAGLGAPVALYLTHLDLGHLDRG